MINRVILPDKTNGCAADFATLGQPLFEFVWSNPASSKAMVERIPSKLLPTFWIILELLSLDSIVGFKLFEIIDTILTIIFPRVLAYFRMRRTIFTPVARLTFPLTKVFTIGVAICISHEPKYNIKSNKFLRADLFVFCGAAVGAPKVEPER